MKMECYFPVGIHTVFAVMMISLVAVACGGGGSGSGNPSGMLSFRATATTTAQSLTVGREMTSFSPLAPSGGDAPYTYSISTGTLPAGLILNSSSGTVTGTPTATYATEKVIFSVQDSHSVVASTTSSVNFTVGAASDTIIATATTTTQNLAVGTAIDSFSPLTPSGGVAPYTYSYVGKLPTGLSFDVSTGAVTGIPTATYEAANLVFSVKDANNVVASTTSTVIFIVSPSISAIATNAAQSLAVGTAISSFTPLTASGGVTPYTYSYTGTLPAGLSLNASTGAVTGTPGAAYTATSVKFSVKDANNVAASTTSTVSFTVAALPAGYLYQGGLIWLPVTTTGTWAQADAYCAGQTARQPTADELHALASSGATIGQGWTAFFYWSSTPSVAGSHYAVYIEGSSFSDYSSPDNAPTYGGLWISCVH